MSFFFFQAEDGIRDDLVTGVQTCALPISGVSVATVDRVINGRGGVHRKTVERVEGVIRQMIGADRPVAPVRRFDALLSGDGGQATRSLAQALVGAGEAACAQVDVAFVETMNPAALAA